MTKEQIKQKLSKAITVRELKELLDSFDDDLPVTFKYNHGDRSNTQVVIPVSGDNILDMAISYSGYVGELTISPSTEEEADEEEPILALVFTGK
jgi:hypothetical protein